MRVVVATVRTPFVRGGAEELADELVKAVAAQGHEVDLLSIPFNSTEPARIPEQMLACRLMDLRAISGAPIDRLIALKFPAYLIPHPHKVIWLLHQYRSAYDLWDHSFGNLRPLARGRMLRGIIQRADQHMPVESKAIFTISKRVVERLRHFCNVDSTSLYHPPPNASAFYCADAAEDYFFFPSRLAANKRHDLVLRALVLTRNPVRVKFAGVADSAEDDEKIRKLVRELRLERRVEWLGFVSHEEKRNGYARSLAVLFPPLDEDYGYVTLEAMLASKAVITCDDSGGPLEFVRHDETGLVTAPEPELLAQAMDALWEDRARAQSYGQNGRRHYERLGLSWTNVVRTLLA